MSSAIVCFVCSQRIKSAHIYECQHTICNNCDLQNNTCAGCQTNPAHHQESISKQLKFEWSGSKPTQHSQHQTPPKPTSLSRQKLQYPNTSSTSHQDRSHYTSIFCQKHDQPVSFYHTSSKLLMCASCLFSGAYSSIRMPQNVVPIKNALEMMRGELRKSYEELTGVATKIEDNLRVCRHSKTVIETNYQSVMDEIHTVCDSMIKAILKKEEEMKEQVAKLLDQKLKYYIEGEKELQRCKEYVKEFRTTASVLRKSEKVDQIAYMFSSEKELKCLLDKLKLDYKQFGLAELSVLRFNKQAFQQTIDKTLQIKKQKEIEQSPSRHYQPPKSKPRKSQQSRRRDRSFSYLNVLKMKGLQK